MIQVRRASACPRRDYAFLGTHGHVIAIRKSNGRKAWQTSLPRTGYEVVSILVDGDQLICASGGRVFGLDAATGEIRWTNALKGLGNGVVYVTSATDGGSPDGTALFAAVRAKQQAAAAST